MKTTGGTICPLCGSTIPLGTGHGCSKVVIADPFPCPSCAQWSVTANDQAQTIEALRAVVGEALRWMDDPYRSHDEMLVVKEKLHKAKEGK